jgi:SAM domain (Sterile alpha motif)
VDIGAWIHGLGLQQYEQALRANEIDDRVLPRLTAEGSKHRSGARRGDRCLGSSHDT